MKNIFYVSSVCSEQKFASLFKECKVKPQQQAQKFHSLLVKGLEQLGHQVSVMSSLPINARSIDKFWIGLKKENEENVHYTYLPFTRLPLIKHLLIFILGFLTCLVWSLKRKNKVLICDVLNISSSVSALIVAKLFRYKSVAIVTDLPGYMIQYSQQKGIKSHILSMYAKVCNYLIKKYDMYLILTEQMNEIVNPMNKPYVVIEGMVDSRMIDIENDLDNKHGEKVILYAGALFEVYGVKKLLEAFMKTNHKDAQLWLFGSGELVDEIRRYEKLDNRIRYFGVVPNADVVMEERRATLLVNPRTTEEDFTKYSFPSKNMEYMVSGTPVLTTKLPGMPMEYNEFVYLIEDESEAGFRETFEKTLSLDKKELHAQGAKAKAFVMKNKNNILQASKLSKIL